MALGDDKGRSKPKAYGKRELKPLEERREKLEEDLKHASNLEVGDFLAELSTAMRYRERGGLESGDFLDDVDRLFTDGRAFGEEIAWPSGTHLQVAVAIDCSYSMWANGIMSVAGPAAMQLHQYLSAAVAELPEGALTYAPFVWALDHSDGRKKSEHGRTAYQVSGDFLRSLEGARLDGNMVMLTTAGHDTYIAPLFRKIQTWERDHDPNAYRIDLVITDGVLEHRDDVIEATKVQEERDGRLSTVMLNFLPRREWSDYALPDRCFQREVNARNLATVLREALSEAVQALG